MASPPFPPSCTSVALNGPPRPALLVVVTRHYRLPSVVRSLVPSPYQALRCSRLASSPLWFARQLSSLPPPFLYKPPSLPTSTLLSANTLYTIPFTPPASTVSCTSFHSYSFSFPFSFAFSFACVLLSPLELPFHHHPHQSLSLRLAASLYHGRQGDQGARQRVLHVLLPCS